MADHYRSSNRVVHFYYGSKRQNLGKEIASRRYHQPPPSWSFFKLGRETKIYPHVTPKILKTSTVKDSNSHSASDAVFRANMCKDVKLSYSHSRAKVEELVVGANYMAMDVKPCVMVEEAASRAKVEEAVVQGNYNTREDVKLVISNSSSFRSGSRAKVEELLKEFHKTLKEKLREDSLNPRAIKRMSVLIKLTMTVIRRKSVNMVKTLGHIPGVHIGDEFEFRAELYLIGLHQQFTKGIDFLKDKNGVLFATSIVATSRGFYDNSIDLRNGVIIYSGEGGNPNCALKGPVMDQKLRCGNLGLKNSREYRKPVRVVIKRSRGKEDPYVYHGLYMVEKYWKVRKGDFGTSIFNFQLRKMAGQSNCF